MNLARRARDAIERRLTHVAREMRAIEGLSVERIGDAIRVRGRGLVKRSIEDVRLRFAGRGR